MKKLLFTYIFLQGVLNCYCQIDSSSTLLNDIVVTATRTERKLTNIAVPVSIITQKNIQQAASLRLNDILNEQAGLFLTAGFGIGVQMQGLNPDYTLILLNGEPLIGRTAGILDLNRVTVGNIKKIEIVKGPSSSLYGSEAMAGVINIITKEPIHNQLCASARYGTYNTKDVNVNTGLKLGKIGLSAFINSYQTDGYSIRPFSVERTVAPLWRLTNQLQVNYPISSKTKLNILGRYNYENINNKISVANTGGITVSDGEEVHKDFNINPTLTHQFSKKVQSSLRLYYSNFNSLQTLKSTSSNYRDYFEQNFYRVENQTDYTVNEKLNFTAGTGLVTEQVNSSRYNSEKDKKINNIYYGFLQAEYKPANAVTIIGGARLDKNNIYASAFSPKLAVNYKVSKKIVVNTSIGRGFKAPDFRQLYLNFTNTAAGGYSVFGVVEAQQRIKELNNAGQIQSLENSYYALGSLKPEHSTGANVGIKYTPKQNLKLGLNIFRNDIENMIDSRLVAYYTSGAQIFSYLNVNKAYTQGAEVDATYNLNSKFTFTAAYQILFTADKKQIEDIKQGLVYTKDASGFARKMELKEYFGLPNRSRHMANIKLLYEYKSLFINTRAIYRSKWAVADKDGNGMYNTNDEFANGFVQLNLSAGYNFKNGIGLQAGSDNILNYIDANNMPNLPGRTLYFSINFKTIK